PGQPHRDPPELTCRCARPLSRHGSSVSYRRNPAQNSQDLKPVRTWIYGLSRSILQEGAEEAERCGNPPQAGNKQVASIPPRRPGSALAATALATAALSALSCSNQPVPRRLSPSVRRTLPIL